MCLHGSEFLDWFVEWEYMVWLNRLLLLKITPSARASVFGLEAELQWEPRPWCGGVWRNQLNGVVLCHRSILLYGKMRFLFCYFFWGGNCKWEEETSFFLTVHSLHFLFIGIGEKRYMYKFYQRKSDTKPPLNPRRLAFKRQNNEVHCLFERVGKVVLDVYSGGCEIEIGWVQRRGSYMRRDS